MCEKVVWAVHNQSQWAFVCLALMKQFCFEFPFFSYIFYPPPANRVRRAVDAPFDAMRRRHAINCEYRSPSFYYHKRVHFVRFHSVWRGGLLSTLLNPGIVGDGWTTPKIYLNWDARAEERRRRHSNDGIINLRIPDKDDERGHPSSQADTRQSALSTLIRVPDCANRKQLFGHPRASLANRKGKDCFSVGQPPPRVFALGHFGNGFGTSRENHLSRKWR